MEKLCSNILNTGITGVLVTVFSLVILFLANLIIEQAFQFIYDSPGCVVKFNLRSVQCIRVDYTVQMSLITVHWNPIREYLPLHSQGEYASSPAWPIRIELTKCVISLRLRKGSLFLSLVSLLLYLSPSLSVYLSLGGVRSHTCVHVHVCVCVLRDNEMQASCSLRGASPSLRMWENWRLNEGSSPSCRPSLLYRPAFFPSLSFSFCLFLSLPFSLSPLHFAISWLFFLLVFPLLSEGIVIPLINPFFVVVVLVAPSSSPTSPSPPPPLSVFFFLLFLKRISLE